MTTEIERQAWLALTELAGRQYGVITRPQAAATLTRAQFETKVRRGNLLPAARGVWRVAGAPTVWRQRVMIACLAVGSPVAASHTTAARLWALDGIAPGRRHDLVHVVVPPSRSGKDIPGAIVHRALIADAEIGQRWDLPVTTVTRTLADVAGEVTSDVLSCATDDAIRRRLIDRADVARLRTRLRTERRHLAGAGRLGLVLDQRLVRAVGDRTAGDSVWEDRVYDWIVDAGLPPPTRQHEVVLPGAVVRLDLAYPDRLIGIDFDGWEWHASRRRFDHDRVRASELAAAGWALIVVTASQSEPDVVGRVRRALQTDRLQTDRRPTDRRPTDQRPTDQRPDGRRPA
jgi:hypothetical protein